MADDPNLKHQERIQAALEAGVPQLYFTGFVNTLTPGDVLTVLERNGKPIAVLNMSYTVTKTFGQSLGSIIATLEEISGRSMLTTHDVEKALVARKEAQEAKK